MVVEDAVVVELLDQAQVEGGDRNDQERFEAFDPTGAYSASVVLALMGVAVLLFMNLLERRRKREVA